MRVGVVRDRLSRIPPPLLSAAAVAALVLWGTAIRLAFLFRSPEPYGVDGYYYAVQMRSLMCGEGLYYPGAPLVFWLLVPFAWIWGPISGVKVGAALGTALGAIPAYRIGRLCTGRRAESLLAVAVVATSAQGLLLSSEFVKQGVATTLLLLFLALLGEAHTAPPARRRALGVAAALSLVACALAHKSAFGMALLFLGCFCGTLWIMRLIGTRGGRGLYERLMRFRGWRGAALLGVSAIGGGAALILLLRGDAALFRGLFAPWGSKDNTGLVWRGEAWLAGLCALWLAALALRGWRRARTGRGGESSVPRPEASALLSGPLLLSLALCLPWWNMSDPLGLGPRLSLMGFLCLSVILPTTVALAMARASLAWRLGVVALFTVGLLGLMPRRNDRMGISGSPKIVGALERLAARIPRDSLLLTTDRRVSFQTHWVTGLKAQTEEPGSVDPSNTYRLLVAGDPFPASPESVELLRALQAFEASSPADLPESIREGERGRGRLWAIPEPTWRAFLASLRAEERARLDPW